MNPPWYVVKELIVNYGLYEAWKMLMFERQYRHYSGGVSRRFPHLNNTQPGAFAYRQSLHKAILIVTLLWYLSHLDSWRGVRFNASRGF